jgi:acyl carrier protein
VRGIPPAARAGKYQHLACRRLDAGLLAVPAGSVAAFDAAAIASKIREFRPYGENAAAIELNGPLRYTGTRLISRGNRANPRRPRCCAASGRGYKTVIIQGFTMPSTFETVANIIAETCDIPRDTITPESHAIDDLGIDSLDFLDIAFAIDKAFGIKLPLEQWTQEVNDGKATTEQYFVLKNLCARIDDLVAAKGQ